MGKLQYALCDSQYCQIHGTGLPDPLVRVARSIVSIASLAISYYWVYLGTLQYETVNNYIKYLLTCLGSIDMLSHDVEDWVWSLIIGFTNTGEANMI